MTRRTLWLDIMVTLRLVDLDPEDRKLFGHLSAYVDDQQRIVVGLGSREAGEIFLHRLLMPTASYVDHVDGNPRNNTRSNLRKCTLSQNQGNRRLNKNNVSGYKGVGIHSQTGLWRARITVTKAGKSREKHLGLYETPEAAARAYNKAAVKYFGEFAKLNKVTE